MIREHMVGSALDSLDWPAARLWTEFGILVPRSSGTVRIDERTDITQLAVVVLSLMAGRRIGPDEYPDKTGELLDELTLKNHLQQPVESGEVSGVAPLARARAAIERTVVHLGARRGSGAGGSAGDPASRGARTPTRHSGLCRNQRRSRKTAAPMWSAARGLPAPAALTPAAATAAEAGEAADRASPHRRVSDGASSRASQRARSHCAFVAQSFLHRRCAWATVVLAGLAIAEAIFIGRLLLTRSGASAAVPAAGGQDRLNVRARASGADDRSSQPRWRRCRSFVATATVDPKLPEIRTLPPPAPAVRTGGVRLTAPIELTVLDGERVIGSSGGRSDLRCRRTARVRVREQRDRVSGRVRRWTSRPGRSSRSRCRCPTAR